MARVTNSQFLKGLFVESNVGENLLAIGWLTLLTIVCLLTLKSNLNLEIISQFSNIVSIIIVVLFVGNWFNSHVIQRWSEYKLIAEWNERVNEEYSNLAAFEQSGSKPHIYYIILDGYGSHEILKKYYDFDNGKFLDELERIGFYIARDSCTNYAQTTLSLASSMNYKYLNDLSNDGGDKSFYRLLIMEMIANNRVMNFLRAQGYLIRVISSGWNFSENIEADIYEMPEFQINTFQNQIINSTPLPLVLDLPFLRNQYDVDREYTLFAFNVLEVNSVYEKQPVFTFAHIVAPHPPFVFGRNGESIQPDVSYHSFDGDEFTSVLGTEYYVEGYRDQIDYISDRVNALVKQILSNSTVDPIIIIQSDHGPGSMLSWSNPEKSNMDERMAILNAYYFPDHDYKMLDQSISPVNTFRVILNKYFKADYDILENDVYFSSIYSPYLFIDLTDQISCE